MWNICSPSFSFDLSEQPLWLLLDAMVDEVRDKTSPRSAMRTRRVGNLNLSADDEATLNCDWAMVLYLRD